MCAGPGQQPSSKRPDAHIHYQALLRRMVRFVEAAECVPTRHRGHGGGRSEAKAFAPQAAAVASTSWSNGRPATIQGSSRICDGARGVLPRILAHRQRVRPQSVRAYRCPLAPEAAPPDTMRLSNPNARSKA